MSRGQCLGPWAQRRRGWLLVLLCFWIGGWVQGQSSDFVTAQQSVEKLIRQSRLTEAKTKAIQITDAELRLCRQADDPRLGNIPLWLGDVMLRLGQFQSAEAALTKALNHRKQFQGKDAAPVAEVYVALAKLYLESASGAKAEAALLAAIGIYESHRKTEEAALYHAKEQYAGLCLMAGRLSDAEHLYDSVLTFEARRLGDQSPELARVLNNLGGVYMAQGRYEQARGAYEQALNLQTAGLGANAAPLATTCTNLGVMHAEQQEPEMAEKYLLRAYSIRQTQLIPTDPLLLASLDNLVSFYLEQKKYREAETLLNAAKTERERKMGPDDPAVAEILDRFATLSMARDQAELANQYWLLALQIRENSLGPKDERVAANLYNLGKLENILHKNDQARIHLNWALDNYEGQTTGNEAQVTAVLSELFLCDYMQGRIEEAGEQLELMRAIKEEVYGPNHPETLGVLEEQVKFYQDTERTAQADQVAAELAARRPK